MSTVILIEMKECMVNKFLKKVVSIVYQVQVENFNELKAADDAKTANFFDIVSILKNHEPILAFDHLQIIKDFYHRRINL